MSNSRNSNTTVSNRKSGDSYLDQVLHELEASKARREEDASRTEALFNSLGEGLIVTDDHGQITRINDYALAALGYTAPELIGKWFPKTIIAVDQYSRPIPTLIRPIMKALTSGKPVSEYAYYLKKDRTLMPVLITVSPVIVDGAPSGAIEVFRDLTKEHQLDVAKEEFVSLASHQLRTPATGVKSILSMLASEDFGPLAPMQKKYLDKAIHTNDRQLQLIEDLLNVALVDSGKLELDLEYTDLVPLLREVAQDHITANAACRDFLQVDTPSSAPLLVDVPKITMVVENLLSNATKYSPDGGQIVIILERQPDQISISIRDHGVGISASDIPKLFTKFTRLPNELSTAVGGTGLGLFLAKNIVELHGGTITVSSTVGKGSDFIITLPTRWGSKL